MTDRKKYLHEIVLPAAVKAGRFGAGLKFIRCERTDGQTGDQYASTVAFVNVVLGRDLPTGDDSEINLKVVLKFLPENLRMREVMNSVVQFHNENVMYTDILPFLNYNDIVKSLFPTFYWGNASSEDGKEPIIVIEDLKNKNFVLSKQRLFLDFNHTVLVLEGLGKFHALSYILKQQKPDEFNKVKDKLVEHVWNREDSGFSTISLIGPAALRGVKALRNIQDNELLEKLTKRLETDPLGLMKYFVKPEEPTAVICHGDFCNHNTLYRYDETSPDTPTSVRFFDLQTSRYASPVIDLAMILLLNTEYELRSRHWDEFITAYYNSVKETVTAAGCIPPTFDQLQQELKNKLFYGYFHCSYFIPIVVSEVQFNMDDSNDFNPSEMMQMMLQMGGEKADQILISILKHFQELNYFGFLD